jgi:hypothetical protein
MPAQPILLVIIVIVIRVIWIPNGVARFPSSRRSHLSGDTPLYWGC